MGLRKKEKSFGGGRLPKNNRNNAAANAGIIAYIIILVMRIPLSRMIGDAGIGLLAPAFELYMLTALLFAYGISRTMTGLIRYRVKRGQHKNAGKVFRTSLRISLFFGIAAALVMMLFSGLLAENLFLEAMSRKAVFTAAPVVLISALISTFRGYFNGNGYGPLVTYSQYIEKTAMLIAGIVGGRLYYGYGQKVSDLLKNDMAASAYGAQGVMLGILAAELLTLIYLLVVFGFLSGSFKSLSMQDGGRRAESSGEILGMLLGIVRSAVQFFYDNRSAVFQLLHEPERTGRNQNGRLGFLLRKIRGADRSRSGARLSGGAGIRRKNSGCL